METSCGVCNLDFETESKLSTHNYDTHSDSIQVTFGDELITVQRNSNSNKFHCPKCETKLKTLTTLKRHVGTHREPTSNAGKKQGLSESGDAKEEFPSVSLDHHAPNTERIDLQVEGSSSFPSTSRFEKETAILIAMNALSLSKREQKKCSMLANMAYLEPITLTSKSGRNYCLLGNAANINDILSDQPVGNWELPLENLETSAESPAASQSVALNHIIKTSPFQAFVGYEVC
ncbi:hypothetical protein BDF20DRAFT_893228 [Mycotypha africana]|uniref:uncharacterized protein n=1 Tax=Mycotypha africana TaxID=64632 RepID=UPI0023009327|nr:uncharacterized protein BDF20DRAFT_893228 [Mycotypha africana]KAI8969097.1 hypothetical protein BDF20DRAFT_893228 [Mycotypha africana]